jgi:hypothetical protein
MMEARMNRAACAWDRMRELLVERLEEFGS